MKKSVLFFTCADQNNLGYALGLINSFNKFHPDIPFLLITNGTLPKSLPKNVMVEDLNKYIKDDQMFFYRQKPIIAEQHMDEYECVVGLDADQVVLAPLNDLWETGDYDVAVVINWNRADPQVYGFVELGRIGIPPPDYYNCGLVAMRSKKFVHHWSVICFQPEFQHMQYKEQDCLNILTHFGNYNVRNLDIGTNWWGIISKGEYQRAELHGENIVVPKGFGDTPFPPDDMTLRVIHAGGGNIPNKMNYKQWFPSEEIITRIDYLVGDKK